MHARTSKLTNLLPVLLVGLMVTACSPEPGEPPLDAPTTWHLVPVETIDGLDLTSVLDLTVAHGTDYLIDVVPPYSGRVLAGREGSWTQIGSTGDGPGEYDVPRRVQFLRDTLWVVDGAGLRVEAFTDDGPARSIRMAATSFPASPYPQAVTADGGLLVRIGSRSIYDITAGLITELPIVRWVPGTERLDTVFVLPIAAEDFWEVGNRNGAGMTAVQHSPLVAFKSDGSGFVVVERTAPDSPEPAAYTIRVFSSSGLQEAVIDVPYRPVPVTETGAAAESIQRLPESMRDVARDALLAFSFHPPVTRVRAGDSEIWIRREQVETDSVWWDVVDVEEGRAVGRVRTSARFEVLRSGPEGVWGVDYDAMDVPHLARYETETADGT